MTKISAAKPTKELNTKIETALRFEFKILRCIYNDPGTCLLARVNRNYDTYLEGFSSNYSDEALWAVSPDYNDFSVTTFDKVNSFVRLLISEIGLLVKESCFFTEEDRAAFNGYTNLDIRRLILPLFDFPTSLQFVDRFLALHRSGVTEEQAKINRKRFEARVGDPCKDWFGPPVIPCPGLAVSGWASKNDRTEVLRYAGESQLFDYCDGDTVNGLPHDGGRGVLKGIICRWSESVGLGSIMENDLEKLSRMIWIGLRKKPDFNWLVTSPYPGGPYLSR